MLPILEQKRVLRHLLGTWNIVRHHAPPEGIEILAACEESRRLRRIKGRVISIDTTPSDQLDVRTARTLVRADLVINCTGPDFRIAQHPSSLIQNLLKRNLAEADALGFPELRQQCHNAASSLLDSLYR